MLKIKRVYDDPAPADGLRVLVDRLWPRGLTKQKARVDEWLKDIAPSDALRKWFAHDPARWADFRRRYQRELDANPPALNHLRELDRKNTAMTLLFSARDVEYNNAVVLMEVLQSEPADIRR